MPEKGKDNGPLTEAERSAIIRTEQAIHDFGEPPHEFATCLFCQEPDPLSASAEWVWREFFEITRNGMSGQLDRQSMDYILRENGITDYSEMHFYRSIWYEVSQTLKDARTPKTDKDTDGQADSGD